MHILKDIENEKDKASYDCYSEPSDTTPTASADSYTNSPARKMNRKKVSTVWQYFTKSKDAKYTKCNPSGKEYKTSGNIRNLIDYLKRMHPLYHTTNNDDLPSTNSGSNINSQHSNCRSLNPFLSDPYNMVAHPRRKNN